jgi:hypothetical protein
MSAEGTPPSWLQHLRIAFTGFSPQEVVVFKKKVSAQKGFVDYLVSDQVTISTLST